MTVHHPRVAVVVPTHDRPELLRRAIDGILAQDYPGPIDVIVVFDKADPDTSLVRESTDRSVRVLPNTRTPGLPGARNSGIAAAAGSEFVAFCDDDDLWLDGKLRAQIDHLARHPGAELCTTGIVIDFEGERTERPSPSSELTLDDLLLDRTTEAHPSTFVFRSAGLGRVGTVDEEIPGGYSEDYDFLLRVAKHGPIVCVREPLVEVRWGRTSYFATRWLAIIDAQRYLLAKHPEFATRRRADARIRGQIAFALAAAGRRRESLREVVRVIARNPLEKRWPVAALVALRLVSAERALEWAHAAGRGI